MEHWHVLYPQLCLLVSAFMLQVTVAISTVMLQPFNISQAFTPALLVYSIVCFGNAL